MFRWQFWGLAALCSVGGALLIGIPTVLIPNPLYIRMTPTAPQDYIIWFTSVVLLGPLVALTVLYPTGATLTTGNRSSVIGTVLSFLSVGCPIWNKIVVLVVGLSGAMTFFNPVRPFLGVASLMILGTTLALRIRVLRLGCPVPTSLSQQSPR